VAQPSNRDRPGSLIAQLVRFDVIGHSVVLDCVAAGPCARDCPVDLAPGQPFALVVSKPGFAWLYASVSALDRWADDGRRISIELSEPSSGRRATLTDGETTTMFDFVAVDDRLVF
jgi:hypothetical protein